MGEQANDPGRNASETPANTGAVSDVPSGAPDAPAAPDQGASGPGPAEAGAKQVKKAPSPRRELVPRKELPEFRVLLHNDDVNTTVYVVRAIVELTPLDRGQAMVAMLTAHRRGVAQLLVTHKERAELYQEQFQSKGLTVSLEPLA